jgi:hypothetical protein
MSAYIVRSMSEVKLNVVDANTILSGTIHGSDADRCIAALSAEPETIVELVAALARYCRGSDPFAHFRSNIEIDAEHYDAGIVVIDLAARVIAVDSTYSSPSTEGEVYYHDGEKATEISIPYRLPDDWRFVNSIEAYRWSSERRRVERQSHRPFDARAVLYGDPLFEFIQKSVKEWCAAHEPNYLETENDRGFDEATTNTIVRIHAEWLMTPRDDLRGKSPREVLLEKQESIEFDLHTRSLQWSMLAEGPPCLSADAFAYRFGGFGTHEWVVYYDLVRYLLDMSTYASSSSAKLLMRNTASSPVALDGSAIALNENSVPPVTADGSFNLAGLRELASAWLERPNIDYDGRIPAIIIENERKRLPQAVSSKELIIDEDCECCRMLAREAEMGFGPTFWHLDGSQMEDEFAFSPYVTRQEWESEMRSREEMQMDLARRDAEKRDWDENQERLARGELIIDPIFDPDPF